MALIQLHGGRLFLSHREFLMAWLMDVLTDTICFPKDQFYMVIVLSLVIIGLVLYYRVQCPVNQTPDVIHQPKYRPSNADVDSHIDSHVYGHIDHHISSRIQDHLRTYDVLTPPFRRSPYPHMRPIYTQGDVGSFMQMGYVQSGALMLPLFGRRIQRNRYEYYVTHKDNPMIKIAVGGRNQTELSNGDELSVNGYDNPMKVNLYSVDYPYSQLVQ